MGDMDLHDLLGGVLGVLVCQMIPAEPCCGISLTLSLSLFFFFKHLLLHVRVHTRRPRDMAIVYMLSYCMAQINWLSLGLE